MTTTHEANPAAPRRSAFGLARRSSYRRSRSLRAAVDVAGHGAVLYPFMAGALDQVAVLPWSPGSGHVSDRAEKTYGHDARAITIDEVAA